MPKFPSLRSAVKRNTGGAGDMAGSTARDGLSTARIPGMVSPEEMAFFSESAARYLAKEGAIVDLGCWLGSTSIALARGLSRKGADAGSGQEKVLGFDTFRWESWMPAQIPYCLYEHGEIFLPEARRLVREHGGDQIELIQADLGVYQWSGGPIKILLVDAMKNEPLSIQIPRSFFPSLVPGSLLIHQDFKHYYSSWIHLLQYQLRQSFRFYQSVPSGTVAFEVVAPLKGSG